MHCHTDSAVSLCPLHGWRSFVRVTHWPPAPDDASPSDATARNTFCEKNWSATLLATVGEGVGRIAPLSHAYCRFFSLFTLQNIRTFSNLCICKFKQDDLPIQETFCPIKENSHPGPKTSRSRFHFPDCLQFQSHLLSDQRAPSVLMAMT